MRRGWRDKRREIHYESLEFTFRQFEKMIEDILDYLFEEKESYVKKGGRSALEKNKL